MKNKTKEKKELGGVIENDKKNYPPTGEWSEKKPQVKEKCTACGQCSKFCPEGVIEIKNKKAQVDFEYCKGCSLCAEICPFGAIEMVRK